MGVYRFEDLRVWQAARQQCDRVGDLVKRQQFLRYAFASNGELKSGYYAAAGRKYLSDAETSELIALNESIARMLRRWQATLDADSGPRTKNEGRTKDQGRTRNQGPSTKDP